MSQGKNRGVTHRKMAWRRWGRAAAKYGLTAEEVQMGMDLRIRWQTLGTKNNEAERGKTTLGEYIRMRYVREVDPEGRVTVTPPVELAVRNEAKSLRHELEALARSVAKKLARYRAGGGRDGAQAGPEREDKAEYRCPGCGMSAWAKPGVTLVCGGCNQVLEAAAAAGGAAVSRRTRYRRKQQGLGNVHYLRYGRFFVIIATAGPHPFREREGEFIKDVRETPVRRRWTTLQENARLQQNVPVCKKTCPGRQLSAVRAWVRVLPGQLTRLNRYRGARIGQKYLCGYR